jgi:hypothetical protein
MEVERFKHRQSLRRGPLPLALRGVKCRGNHLLAVSVVARDVEELTVRAWHAAPESMDEGRARRAILERRDGVFVCRTEKLGAALGEASYVLA